MRNGRSLPKRGFTKISYLELQTCFQTWTDEISAQKTTINPEKRAIIIILSEVSIFLLKFLFLRN